MTGVHVQDGRADLAVGPEVACFPAMLDDLPDALVMVDGGGRIVWASRPVERLLGWSRAELVGQPVETLLTERLRDLLTRCRADHTERAPPTGPRSVVFALKRDGGELPVDVSLSPLETPDGLLVVAALRDDSERLQREQLQLEFLAAVGHELRNPLTAIVGRAQLLDQRRGYDPKSVDVIRQQGHHLNRLISDLLDVARLEARLLELRRERVDLVVLAKRTIEGARTLSDRHQLRLETPSEPLEWEWDPDRLEQVLQNLLSNAIKYSPAGGEVLVRVERLAGEARVSVIDHGPGIDPAELPLIFGRFHRTAAARAGQREGLGLGLYIARLLVEAHGGQLTAASALGQGSTFTLSLPLTAARTASRAAVSRAAERTAGQAAVHARPQARILVVEDDSAVRETLVSMLRQAGYEVLEAANGATGLRLAERERPALLILDLALPELSGLELLRELRQERSDPAPRVIVVTGWARVLQHQPPEVCAVLGKPVAPAALLAEVERALGTP